MDGLRPQSANFLSAPRWPLRLLLAALSGATTWPLSLVAEILDASIPLPWIAWQTVFVGSVFSGLVLVPWIPPPRRAPLRILGLTAASVLAYAVSLQLTVTEYGPLELDLLFALPLSGALGAVMVTLAVVFIAPREGSWKLYGLVTAAGLIGGLAFFPAIFEKGDTFAILAYVTWQVLVAGGLSVGLAGRIEDHSSA